MASIQFRLPVFVLLAALAVCARAVPPAELRIGYQKSSVNLLVARHLGAIERRFPGSRVRWVEFTAGPQLLEALGARNLDFGMTGDTPPIFAQAAGRDILYVGQEPAKPRSSAILVPPDSKLATLADLRGRRVAFQKGSSAHYLVLRAISKAGLHFGDIQPVYLAPADARAALVSHSIDAWAIWDPYWAAATQGTRVKVLSTAEGIADDDTFYEASREFVEQHPEAIEAVFAALNEADQHVRAHPEQAAEWIAAATGLDREAAATFLSRRSDSPVSLLDAREIAKQQAVADTFVSAGLVPRRVVIADAVWHPKQTSAAR